MEELNSLKKLRKAVGLKQYEAAKSLNISKDYLCMLENGRRYPSNKVIIKMSKLYNVAPQDIFLIISRTICSTNQQSA